MAAEIRMDRSVVWLVVGLLAVIIPVTLVFAFKSPAQFRRLMQRLSFWYNIFVLGVFACLLGGAIIFALGAFLAEKHELFFWLYMTAACLFGAFAFLSFATRHMPPHGPAGRIGAFLRQTTQQWRERYGPDAKGWKDAG